MSILHPELYTVAWIAPLEIEARVALHMLDKRHPGQFTMHRGDDYVYIAGEMCGHNIVIATLPAGQEYGTGSAAALASQVKKFFPNLWFGLLVGVAAGLPNLSSTPPRDIRLGDILVALPDGESAGLVAYDLGKEVGDDHFQPLRAGHILAHTEAVVRSAIGSIKLSWPDDTELFLPYYEQIKEKEHTNGNFMDPGQEHDRLYKRDEHGAWTLVNRPRRLDSKRTRVWYGPIGSGEKLVRNTRKRDMLQEKYNLIGLEMEAAGTMNRIPVGVVRGVCDYADEHKNKEWQPYAAAMAAAYAKAILHKIPPRKMANSAVETTVSLGGQNSGLQVGINNGLITSELRLPPATSSPFSTVPFPRDRDFVDHGGLLDQIREKSSEPASKIGLVGFGGVGKTQLAIEYSYRLRDWAPETFVFWVHASNVARFEESFREIADRLEISDRKNPKVNIFKLVCDWLQGEEKRQWVIILDNVDDDRFLHCQPSSSHDGSEYHKTDSLWKPLLAYIPVSPRGSTILTTRSKLVASRLVEDRDIITVEPMDAVHAQILFQKKLQMQEDQDDIRELAATLDFMPLAIVQAAAYIKQRAPRSSVRLYLKEVKKSDRKKLHLLVDYEGGRLRRDWEAKNSIILTWQMSFDHIRQERPTAADILSLMSFFDNQGIPECLLRDQLSNGEEEIVADSDTDDAFEDDIHVLRSYCFISMDTSGSRFLMHRLVQLATQKWLEEHGQFEHWKQRSIRNLSSQFPSGEYRNWEKCQLLYPHARLSLRQQPVEKSSLGEWALLLNNAAWFAWRKGNALEAEEMASKAMETRKALHPFHEHTLNSIDLMGLILNKQGKFGEAESMHREALAGREKVLGVNHPNTLATLSNLGSVFIAQGKYMEAESMYRRALAGYDKTLRVDHPYVLASVNNLGLVLNRQGKLDEAESMHRGVLALREEALGVNHPYTLTSLNNLGSVFTSQGKYTEAETTYRRALTGYQNTMGIDNPDALSCMYNLSLAMKTLGQDRKGLELFKKCVQLHHRKLGSNHPNTISAMKALEEWQASGHSRSRYGYSSMSASKMIVGFPFRFRGSYE